MDNATVIPRVEALLALSIRERLRLLSAIVESLEEEADEAPRLTKAQLQEVQRRRRAYLRNPSAAKTWEEVLKAMRQQRGACASRPRRKRN